MHAGSPGFHSQLCIKQSGGNPSIWRWRQEDQKFKVILRYTEGQPELQETSEEKKEGQGEVRRKGKGELKKDIREESEWEPCGGLGGGRTGAWSLA